MNQEQSREEAGDHSQHHRRSQQTSEREELRTIAFRMREIQRLFSIRVEQENRKLEADGIKRVTNTRFSDPDEEPSEN